MDGEWSAFEELERLRFEDPRAERRRNVARLNVAGFYLMKNRHAGTKLSGKRDDGTPFDESNITTDLLLKALVVHPRFNGRARAAELLGEQRHSGVPEALLKAMNGDSNTWVRTAALAAVENLTGFNALHAFAFEEAQKWYAEHSAEVAQRLTPGPDAGKVPSSDQEGSK